MPKEKIADKIERTYSEKALVVHMDALIVPEIAIDAAETLIISL